LTIRGVIVGTGPTDNPASVPISVIVSYMPVAGGPYPPSTGLGIQQTAGSTLHGGYAIPTSQVQDARVNGRPAAYAHGAWTEAGVWDGTLDAGMLSWEEGGFTYVVHSSGLGLGREDLVKIAESLR
ncbi:MAG TPA: hypothetical protein VFL91_27775, partial [Thermomicrobiales bacterium]|nr:hypothetical protein [Thermomicrobiales bacterium]